MVRMVLRDDILNYRDQKEINKWKKKDPLKLFENTLVKRKLLDATSHAFVWQTDRQT